MKAQGLTDFKGSTRVGRTRGIFLEARHCGLRKRKAAHPVSVAAFEKDEAQTVQSGGKRCSSLRAEFAKKRLKHPWTPTMPRHDDAQERHSRQTIIHDVSEYNLYFSANGSLLFIGCCCYPEAWATDEQAQAGRNPTWFPRHAAVMIGVKAWLAFPQRSGYPCVSLKIHITF